MADVADGRARPMLGQNNHFRYYAPEQLPYAVKRYGDETHRLFGVMNKRLADREFLAGAYSIADMACVGWARGYERQGIDIEEFPHVKRWLDTLRRALRSRAASRWRRRRAIRRDRCRIRKCERCCSISAPAPELRSPRNGGSGGQEAVRRLHLAHLVRVQVWLSQIKPAENASRDLDVTLIDEW